MPGTAFHDKDVVTFTPSEVSGPEWPLCNGNSRIKLEAVGIGEAADAGPDMKEVIEVILEANASSALRQG